jgi:hypothetical protein
MNTFSRAGEPPEETGSSSSKPFRSSRNPYVRRLGEAGYGPGSGRIGNLDPLAGAGLPIPEGVVLTREAHYEFLKANELLRAIRDPARGGENAHQKALRMQLGYGSSPIEGELNRATCEALIELGAPAVVVLSEDLARSGLTSIPEVQGAIREAWLSLEGLKLQIEAAARGEEVPAWPILIQREMRPEYTGWSTTREPLDEELEEKGLSKARKIGLYDVKPTAGGPTSSAQKSIAHLTLEAEYLLGEPVRMEWGLEDGRWYVLSVTPRKAPSS